MQDRLDRARDDATFAIQEQKRDDANERWQRGGERCGRAQYLSTTKFDARQQEGERYADGGGEDDGRDGDPDRRPQRLAIRGTVDERFSVSKSVRKAPRDDGHVGIDHCPQENSEQRPRDEWNALSRSSRAHGRSDRRFHKEPQ